MWSILKLLNKILNYACRNRFAELVFAGGLPIIGYIVGMNHFDQLFEIWIMMIATCFVGWHIQVVNDVCFPEKRVSPAKLIIAGLLPVFSFIITIHSGYYDASLFLFLMIINWHIYSRFFKGFFPMSLLHNFCGGFLHTGVGMLFSGMEIDQAMVYGIYFGFMMTGASMQHDALDYREDKNAGYRTGAVYFGREKWWRLGAAPIILANIILIFECTIFRAFLLTAFLIYILCYIYFYNKKFDELNLLLFRFISRIIYGLAGVVYISVRIMALRNSSA